MKAKMNRVLHNASQRSSALTARGILTVLFRRRRLVTLSFLGTALGVFLAIVLLPESYQAEVKFLVERQRIDPVITAEQKEASSAQVRKVTEDELNSEVELLMSRDLLERVVIACRLYEPKNPWSLAGMKFRVMSALRLAPDQKTRIYNSMLNLEQKLQVNILPNSDLIKATYSSSSPRAAADVLDKLSAFYIEKNAAVHRPTGTYEFFQQQTKEYEKALNEAQLRLVAFNRSKGVVSAEAEKQISLQKMNEFDTSLRQTRAAIAETQQRMRTLETLTGSTPQRVTTQVRMSGDSQLLSNLKSTLLTLELKRTELLQKFAPTYRLVQEVDQQIAQTRNAIQQAESSSLKEETTDRDPTYNWAQTELAKAKSDLMGLEARAIVMERTVGTYRQRVMELDEASAAQQNLLRAVKTGEENYMLFRQKQEEAGIADALNQKRILNVGVAQPASVPLVPAGPGFLLKLGLGVLLAGLVSVGTAFGADYLDPSFRTPAEVETELSIPVLAAVPETINGFSRNGHSRMNGNGNGHGRANGHSNGHGTNGSTQKTDRPIVYSE